MQQRIIDKLTAIVKIWSQISNNVRIRDRTVKAIQYGCQMLIGVYGQQLKEDLLMTLKLTRRTASTSRKAFWLMKSINHICTFVDLFADLQKTFTVTGFLDLLEQFFLIIYYFFENIVFLIRISVFTHLTEDDIDLYVNWSNFFGDIAGFLSVLIHFCHKFWSWRDFKNRIGKGNLLMNNENQIKEDVLFRRDLFDTSIALIVAGMELMTSIEFVQLWPMIIGQDLGDAGVGFCGFASSLLIIADNLNKAFRANIGG